MPQAARRWTDVAVLAGLLLALHLGLFAALASCLAIQALHASLRRSLLQRLAPRQAAVASVALTVIAFVVLAAGAVEAVHALWAPRGLPGLLELLADTLDRLRAALPDWVTARLPESTEDLQRVGSQWLRANAHSVQRWGHDLLRLVAHILLGMVIGLLGALEHSPRLGADWMEEVAVCWRNLVLAFSRYASAQLRIAAVNTAFTAVFLAVALPLWGVHVPLLWTLVGVTFVAALVPIVGNLLSNGAIVLAALTVSPGAALASLLFLLAIHKLEYFLNAHFVGRSTHVPAPVLLASMLVLEAAVGVPGLVAAPVYCAWVFQQFGGPTQRPA